MTPAHASLELANPGWLLALLLIPLTVVARRRRRLVVGIFPFSSLWARHARRDFGLRTALAVLGLALVVVALARPRERNETNLVKTSGYKIMLAVDVSISMRESDAELEPKTSRMEVLKNVIRQFVARRTNDQIGLVIFGGSAYTVCPPTSNHPWLMRQLDRLQPGMLGEGTAIGDAIALAGMRVGRAAFVRAGSSGGGRIVILMTDGESNSGIFSPYEAVKQIQSSGIPVYTVGVGRSGFTVPYGTSATGLRGPGADEYEDILPYIAGLTGGESFRASDRRALDKIFARIDEQSRILLEQLTIRRFTELFPPVLSAGLLMFLGAVFGPGVAGWVRKKVGGGRRTNVAAPINSPQPAREYS